MKKIKINKKKFIPRMALLIGIIIIVLLLTSNNKTNEVSVNTDPKLIVDLQNITEDLINPMYFDEVGSLYLSTDDIKEIFDKNLYLEESTSKLITTSDTKTAAIDINCNTIEINTASLLLKKQVLKKDNIIYIPVSEITNIYNIEVKQTGETAVILSLYKALTTVTSKKDISLKEDTGMFSKAIQKIEKGQELIFIENSENNGWYKILTYEGNIGLVKSSEVSEKKQIRVDMNDSDFTNKDIDLDNAIELTYRSLKTENLEDFSSRKKIVEDTVSSVISKEKYNVKIIFNNVEVDTNLIERFLIELIPRLKEIGCKLAVINYENILSEKFLQKMNL